MAEGISDKPTDRACLVRDAKLPAGGRKMELPALLISLN
jgi:hypothetical protein